MSYDPEVFFSQGFAKWTGTQSTAAIHVDSENGTNRSLLYKTILVDISGTLKPTTVLTIKLEFH